MAGHSKWSNIKHRKAGQDAKRAKVFTKIIRELTVAARDGGGNIEDNPSLRTVVEKAKSAQMPKDTMERAIARGAGGQDGADLVALTYEGYGPGGVAFLVETMTDNRNRTVAEVRHIFSKSGGNLGTDGSVAYLFDKRGQIFFEEGVSEEALFELAIEAGADDVEVEKDGSIAVITSPEAFTQVKAQVDQAGMTPALAEITMAPQTYAELDEEMSERIIKMIDLLEELDDVTNVYTNANLSAAYGD